MTLQGFERKQFVKGSLVSVMLAVFFVLGARPVEAVSYPATKSYFGVLYYQATAEIWTYSWKPGLSNIDVTVNYNADVYDNTTGALITVGATIPVGTVVRFEPSRGQITWNGKGYTSDTPFGHWVNNAARPGLTGVQVVSHVSGPINFRTGSCLAADYVDKPVNPYDGLETPVYIPFAVHPEAMTVDVSGSTAGLSSLGGNVYQVTAPGSIVANFHFDPTFGRFYYEYRSMSYYAPGSCFTSWDLKPMSITGNPFGFNPAFNLPVPAVDIPYTITVEDPLAAGNNPPETPVVTGFATNSHIAGDFQNFSVVANDVDGDAIKYLIDFNGDNLPDDVTGYVAPNLSQTTMKKWLFGGEYTIRAKAVDTNGAESGWGSYTIKVCDSGYTWNGAACQPPLADLIPLAMLHPSTVFNTTTGIYESVVVEYWAKNIGDTTVTDNFANTIALDRDNDGVIMAADSQIDPMSDNLAHDDESGHHVILVATNVPAGNHVIKISLDTGNAVTELYDDNNETSLSLNPIVPTLTLTLQDKFVRYKTSTTMHWTVDMAYLDDCKIVGPGVDESIDPSSEGTSGNLATGVITAKSQYVFSCTLPDGMTYSTNATVETNGRVEEI